MANNVTWIFKALDSFTNVGKKIRRGIKGVNTDVKKLDKSLKKNARNQKKFGNEISSQFKRMAIAATAYVSAAKLITTGAEFQDSLADLSSITGASGEKLDFLSEQALKLAKSSNIAQSEVVRAFTDIASAKSELLDDPKAIITITEQALLLANAAGINVPDAVKASVGALNQFGVGADQAARFVNVLAAGAKVGTERVSGIVESMKNAGPIAAQFNVSFEETNALLQVLSKNGLKAAEAGTALRTSLVILEQLEGGAIAPSMIGITKSLELLTKAELNNVALVETFGRENLNSILILRKNLPLFKQWKEDIKGTNVAQEQANIRLSTFNSKMKGLGITINESLIKTFLKLEPVLTEQAEAFAAFIVSIKPEQVEGFANSLSILLRALVLVGKVVGFLLKKLERMGIIIGEIAGAISTLDFSQFSFNSFADAKEDLSNLFGLGSKKKLPISPVEAAKKDIPKLFDVNSKQKLPGSPIADAKKDMSKLIGLDNKKKLPVSPIEDANIFNKGLIDVNSSSQTDVNINLKAPQGTVESIESKTTGKTQGLNVGVNMAAAL